MRLGNGERAAEWPKFDGAGRRRQIELICGRMFSFEAAASHRVARRHVQSANIARTHSPIARIINENIEKTATLRIVKIRLKARKSAMRVVAVAFRTHQLVA